MRVDIHQIQAEPLLFEPGASNKFQPIVLQTAPEAIRVMPEGTLLEKVLKALEVLKWVLQRREVCFSYSGGKDSSTILALGLAAAAQLKAAGLPVSRFLVLNSNTQVENPEVEAVVSAELARVSTWIKKHDLPGHITVTEPYILSHWAVSIIGGKTLISTPLTNRNCTTDLKSSPLGRARNDFFGKNKVAKGKYTVGVTGVRFSESAERAGNMAKRAESPVDLVQTNEAQDVFIAPIANWSTDDVMEFLGLVMNHDALQPEEQIPFPVYSDFQDVWRIYRDAASECVVGNGGGKPSTGCGARHGCYVCTMVGNDKSMDAFLSQERYAYMSGLSRFREYLVNTVYDYSQRIWIGRTIREGNIVYGPDAYSPEYTQNLLRFALTIDRDEELEAARLGIAPRFRIVPPRALIAIDAMWSLQAYALPFTALAIYHQVYVKGMRFEVPVVDKVPHSKPPVSRYIPVSTWDEGSSDAYTGLRNPLLELSEGGCTTLREVTVKGSTRLVMTPQVDQMFEVHQESVDFLLMFELERLVEKHYAAQALLGRQGFAFAGQGYKYYVSFGAISLAKAQVGEVDSILRRSSWRERNGFAGYNYDKEAAYQQSTAEPTPLVSSTVALEASSLRTIKRDEVLSARIPLATLYAEWSPDVDWRSLLRVSAGVGKKLFAHCLYPTEPSYAANQFKGWAKHHFIRKGCLIQLIKESPGIAQAVIRHRAVRRATDPQLDLFAA